MARTRARSAGRVARRSNWLATVEGFSNTAFAAGSTTNVTLLDVTDAAREEHGYVDPTIVRIRGFICVDPDFPADASIRHCHVQLSLYAAEVGVTTWNATQMSKDWVLWTGGYGYSRAAQVIGGGAGTGILAQVWLPHPPIEIDVKAMRRLGDSKALFLQVHVDGTTTGGSSPTDARLSYVLRTLVME